MRCEHCGELLVPSRNEAGEVVAWGHASTLAPWCPTDRVVATIAAHQSRARATAIEEAAAAALGMGVLVDESEYAAYPHPSVPDGEIHYYGTPKHGWQARDDYRPRSARTSRTS